MTLSMNKGIEFDPTSRFQTQRYSNQPKTDSDFGAMLQMLLANSLNSPSISKSGYNFQNLLSSLAPFLQNLSINTPSAQPPAGFPVHGGLTQEYHGGHQGLDFGIEIGTTIKSTMNGTVTYAGWNDEGYGNLVIVDNGTYQTYYGHLDSIPVKVGEPVFSGQAIGLSGNTGNSTGPHLHYEIRINKQPIDPTAYVFGKTAEYM